MRLTFVAGGVVIALPMHGLRCLLRATESRLNRQRLNLPSSLLERRTPVQYNRYRIRSRPRRGRDVEQKSPTVCCDLVTGARGSNKQFPGLLCSEGTFRWD